MKSAPQSEQPPSAEQPSSSPPAATRKPTTPSNYTSAINTYYSAHPACLWSDPKQVPRSGRHLRHRQDLRLRRPRRPGPARPHHRREEGHDHRQQAGQQLRPLRQGPLRLDRRPQPARLRQLLLRPPQSHQHRQRHPNHRAAGATTQVTYHYTLADVPAWATAAETQTAFPSVQTDLAGPQSGQATLTNTSNGWQVTQHPQHQPHTTSSSTTARSSSNHRAIKTKAGESSARPPALSHTLQLLHPTSLASSPSSQARRASRHRCGIGLHLVLLRRHSPARYRTK